jgi:Na+/H+-dicarboxylate symporter
MLVGGLVGAGGGLASHMLLRDDPGLATFIRYVAQPVGQVYIRLLFMLVIPLVLPALALGIAGLGDLRRVGRIGMRTLAYTVVVSTIAVLLGLGLTNLLRPGDGMSEATRARLVEGAGQRAAAITGGVAPKSGVDLLVQIVPRNPVSAMAEGDMLAVMFFALMLGIGLAVTRTDAARQFERALEGTVRRDHAPDRHGHRALAAGRCSAAVHVDGAAGLRGSGPACALRGRGGAGAVPCTSSWSTRWSCARWAV